MQIIISPEMIGSFAAGGIYGVLLAAAVKTVIRYLNKSGKKSNMDFKDDKETIRTTAETVDSQTFTGKFVQIETGCELIWGKVAAETKEFWTFAEVRVWSEDGAGELKLYTEEKQLAVRKTYVNLIYLSNEKDYRLAHEIGMTFNRLSGRGKEGEIFYEDTSPAPQPAESTEDEFPEFIL